MLLAFTFRFVRQKVQNLSKILSKISNFVIFRHPKLNACFIKWVPKMLLLKMPLFVCQKVKNSKFRQISSQINIFVTTTSFLHFVKNEIL